MPLPIIPFGAEAYKIDFSARLRAANSAYLTRTNVAAPTNEKVFALSWWAKRGLIGTGGPQTMFGGTSGQASNISFGDLVPGSGADRLAMRDNDVGAYILQSNGLFRDPTGWNHFLARINTTQATASLRARLYANGSEISYLSSTWPALNYVFDWNAGGRTVSIGRRRGDDAQWYFDGYLAEIILVDGQDLDPSAFGRIDPTTGFWVPRRYTGTFGANGGWWRFADASAATAAAFGKDSAPIDGVHTAANNWTPHNISVTAGPTCDQSRDTPTRNMPTLTPLIAHNGGATLNANLGYSRGSTSAHGAAAASRTLPTTGKHGWEVISCASTNNDSIGVADITVSPQLPSGGTEIGNRSGALDYIYRSNGIKASNGATTAYGATFTNASVITVLWDADAGQISFRKDGADQGVAYSGITPVAGKFAPAVSSAESSGVVHFNFGQRPFAYALPAGYTALGETTVNATTASGTFTGNASSDGRVVDIGGTPATLTINGNAVTWGTHAIKLANGFKIITSSSSYNAAGSNSWTATGIVPFQLGRRRFNNGQVN